MKKTLFVTATAIFLSASTLLAHTPDQKTSACINQNVCETAVKSVCAEKASACTTPINKCDYKENCCNRQSCQNCKNCSCQNCNRQNCESKNCTRHQNCKRTPQCKSEKSDICNNNITSKCGKHHGHHDGEFKGKKSFPAKALNPFAGIELTESQKAAFEKAEDSRNKKSAKAKETYKKSMDKTKSDFNKDIEKILTPQQILTYKANLEKRKHIRERFAKPCPESKGFIRPGKLEKAPAQPPLTSDKENQIRTATPMKK